MTVARRAANRGIPAADRTVEGREDKNRSARSAVFRDGKVGRGGANVSDDTGRRAKRPRGAAWCRRYGYEEWNLLTSPIVERREAGAIVASPPGARGECNETPGVDQMWVSKRRYCRTIRN